MGIKEWLIPQDEEFFSLFETHAKTVVAASKILEKMMNKEIDAREAQKVIKDLEHDGDSITHQIFNALNRTFITPLDPLEISRLGAALDDVLDYIDDSAEKIVNYNIIDYDHAMIQFSSIIRRSAEEIEIGVKSIRNHTKLSECENCYIEVNRLENMADDLLSHATRHLFECKDPIRIIKFKDVYECLEISTDKCEDVVNILSYICIRHA
ncbi:MAG: DUF47 family protein [Methanospirillum sp.]|uniref:DUF47 domain-containing protein n=1 Tax=Methanospirillum sp. TaxID=45200 RepID=UPI00236C6B5D|nr:DUF47 family protein [Methanospirillum sp.]MDD1730390.1 DUF47 family protein [Methanospirillum sp.]